MTKSHTNLTGMFFILDKGDRFFTGAILSEITDGIYLTQADGNGVQYPKELMSIDDMLGTTNYGGPNCSLFSTRAEMDDWLTWIETPSEPRVINLVKK